MISELNRVTWIAGFLHYTDGEVSLVTLSVVAKVKYSRHDHVLDQQSRGFEYLLEG